MMRLGGRRIASRRGSFAGAGTILYDLGAESAPAPLVVVDLAIKCLLRWRAGCDKYNS